MKTLKSRLRIGYRRWVCFGLMVVTLIWMANFTEVAYLTRVHAQATNAARSKPASTGAVEQRVVTWRRANKADCDAEYDREVAEWVRLCKESHICFSGDPSITMGSAVFTVSKDGKGTEGYGEEPCGFVSDETPPSFRTRYWQYRNKREITLTKDRLYRAVCQVVYTYKRDEKVYIYPKPEWTECQYKLKGNQ